MDELVRWLLAQLDEDERIARKAGERSMVWRLVTPLDDAESGDAWWLNPPEKYHAERHDPARVLREVDGRRRTLIRCQEALLAASPMLVHFAKQTLVEMALDFSDRPGYAEAVAAAG